MDTFLAEYGLFLAKTATVVVAAFAIAAGVAVIAARGRRAKGRIEVTDLSRRLTQDADTVRAAFLPRRALRQLRKTRRREQKADAAAPEGPVHKLFVLDFHGDIRASAVASLREEISAILMAAGPGDEVLLRLESPGGMVNAYGLAASQLLRLREKDIPLTVAVDKVAASGGYLMAAVADRIIAAPFAVLGSIGVVAQIPNFHRWLRDRRIDFELFTAGEFKRTVTVFGENTEQGREKLREEIADTHQLFQDFVKRFRPQLDMARVATGEPWYGTRALEMGLVDTLATSDSYLMDATQRARIYAVSYKRKKTLGGKLFATASGLLSQFSPPRH